MAEADDLEALFDSIAGSVVPEPAPVAEPPPVQVAVAAPVSSDLYAQVGQLTRKLHDVLRDIGHDRVGQIHSSAEQASNKAKTAVDTIGFLQEALESTAGQLSSKWQQLMEGKLSVEEFKALAGETRSYLQEVSLNTQSTNTQLKEISLIQDVQSIRKLGEVAQQLEGQLMQALIASAPEAKKKELSGSATTPDQVKAALGSLGF